MPDNGRGGENLTQSVSSPAQIQQPPFVVVLGMHRSGTSLCSQVLRALGVAMGDHPEARPSNLKGQWERLEIVKWHDRILDIFDRGYYSPLHDLPLPTDWQADPRVEAVQREILDFLQHERAGLIPFGFKDPRTARLLPMWRHIFDELGLAPKVVLCVRGPAQVARSLQERDGLPPDLGEYRWLHYMAEIFRNSGGLDACTLSYDAWFDQSADNLETLAKLLGMPADAALRATLSKIVDPELRHDGSEPPGARLALARRVYGLALRWDTEPAARNEAARLFDEVALCRQLHRPIEQEFEQLSRLAAGVLQAKRGGTGAPILSWRDPAVAAELSAAAVAAKHADALGTRLRTVLEQRAELDAEVARLQQQAAQRTRALEAAQREITALHDQHRSPAADAPQPGDLAAAAGDAGEAALAALARIPPPPRGRVNSSLAAQFIDTVLAQDRPEQVARLLNVRRGDPEFSYLLALKLLEAKRLAEAEQAALAATEAAPTNAKYFERLAGVLWRAGKRSEAIEPMRTACELDPQWAHPREGLAKMLAAIGPSTTGA